jgi:hypothetical protein
MQKITKQTIMKQILLTALTISMLTSCEFISNTFKYKDTTKEFSQALIKEDYKKCISLMAMEHETANKNPNTDTLKIGLANFRQSIVKNFGTDLEYSFMSSEKKFSTEEGESTPPNTTVVFVEFANKKEFGVLKVLFDDKSNKIINIKTLEVKESIPSMTLFWIFGLIAICVLLFNIYVIRQVKRSNLEKKWLKYIAILFFNVPALTYNAVNGFSYSLLSFQVLFGLSFSYMGYLNFAWTFGIPLGGLYWLWKLRQRSNLAEQIITQTEQPNTEDRIEDE